jgi:hypothetical protein
VGEPHRAFAVGLGGAFDPPKRVLFEQQHGLTGKDELLDELFHWRNLLGTVRSHLEWCAGGAER